MSNTLRVKRTLAIAAAGALVLGLLPAGAAFAGVEEVCENAPDSDFGDKGTTHGDNIDCLAAYDITSGTTATTFGTFQSLTRGQAATLFVNFAVTATDGAIIDDIDEDEDVPFTDIEGTTHETNIEALYRLDLASGTTATTYSPNATITRGQFAQILFNAHVTLGVEFDDDYPNAFVDSATSIFADAINALAGEGIISGTSETTYSPNDEVTRGQTASLLILSAGVLDDADLWDAPRLAPIGAGASVTEAPELINIQVVEDDDPVVMEFHFDEEVEVIGGDFKLYPADDPNNPVSADVVEVDEDDETVVLAEFDLDEDDFAEVTVATVEAGSVADEDDNENPEGARPVQSSTVSGAITDLPDLLSVENFRNAGLDGFRVDFVFDDDALEAAPADYVLVDVDGETEYVGQTFVDGDDEDVHTIDFDRDDIDDEDDVARGYIVEDALPGGNPQQAAEVSGASETPDLVEVEFDEDQDRATFEFDESVSATLGAAALFSFYDEDGTTFAGTDAERISLRVVRVEFAADTVDDDTAVGGFVEAGAVSEVTGEERENLPDEARLDTGDDAFAAGETEGLELESVEISVSDSTLGGDITEVEAVFVFEDDVDTVSGAGDFHLYLEEDGLQLDGQTTDIDDNEVTVTYDDTDADFDELDDLEDIVLAGIAEAAAVEGGFNSPEASVEVTYDN